MQKIKIPKKKVNVAADQKKIRKCFVIKCYANVSCTHICAF